MRADFVACGKAPGGVEQSREDQHEPQHDLKREASFGATDWLGEMTASLAIHRLWFPLIEQPEQDGRKDKPESQD